MALRNVLVYTAINSLALFLLGINVSQRYTAFNDLILISDVSATRGSFYITSGNFGYLLGTLSAGVIYDRLKQGQTMVVALALAMVGIFTALIPWCSIFATMLCVHFVANIISGIYETLVNTEEVQAWDGHSESAMQFLSFTYSLGGIVGPLITEPFLAPKTMANDNKTTSNTSHNNILPPFLPSPLNTSLTTVSCDEVVLNCADYGCHYYSTNSSLSTSIDGGAGASGPMESRIHYAFAIPALLSLLTAVPFFVLCVKFQRDKMTITDKETETKEEPACLTRRLPKEIYLSVMALSCAFYLVHFMVEDSFGQYLFFFVTTALDWRKTHGAWLVSLYWAVFTVARLLLVFILRRLDTGILLFACTIGMVFSCVLFIIAVSFNIDQLIWISVSAFALSAACVYAGELSWVDANLSLLGGKEASTLMIVSGIGGMTGPLILSIVKETWSLMALPYIFFVECCFTAGVFAIKLFMVKPLIIRKYGPPRLISSENVDVKFESSSQPLNGVREPEKDTEINTQV